GASSTATGTLPAAYDPATGVRPAILADYFDPAITTIQNTSSGGTVPLTAAVRIAGTATTAGASPTVRYLTMAPGSQLNTGTERLKITEGTVFVEAGGTATVTGGIYKDGGSSLNLITIGDLFVDGGLSASYSTVQKLGAGTLTLANTSFPTFRTGNIHVLDGRLNVTNSQSLSDGARVNVKVGARADFASGITARLYGLDGEGQATIGDNSYLTVTNDAGITHLTLGQSTTLRLLKPGLPTTLQTGPESNVVLAGFENRASSGVISGGTSLRLDFGPRTNASPYLELSGVNTYTGTTHIGSTIAPLSPAKIILAGTDGALLGTSSILIDSLARLELKNSYARNDNRVGDAIPITLRNGGLAYYAPEIATGTTQYEILGDLTLSGTPSLVAGASPPFFGTPGDVDNVMLSFGTLVRPNNALLSLQPTVTGKTVFGGSGTNNRVNVRFAGGISGANAAVADPLGPVGGQNQAILPWVVITDKAFDRLNAPSAYTLATYDPLTGVNALTAGSATDYHLVTTALGANRNNFINVSTASITLTAASPVQINALAGKGTLTLGGDGVLSVNSGLIALPRLSLFGSSIDFGTAHGSIYGSFSIFGRDGQNYGAAQLRGSNGISFHSHDPRSIFDLNNLTGHPFTGGLTASNATVRFSNDDELGASGGAVLLEGGNLEYSGLSSYTLPANRVITVGNAGGSIGNARQAGGVFTISAPVSASGPLHILGNITAGSGVTLAGGGTVGDLLVGGNVTLGGTLNRTGDLILDAVYDLSGESVSPISYDTDLSILTDAGYGITQYNSPANLGDGAGKNILVRRTSVLKPTATNTLQSNFYGEWGYEPNTITAYSPTLAFNIGAGITQTLSGVISNSGPRSQDDKALSLGKYGLGTLTLTNANQFTGGFTMNEGLLVLAGAGQAQGNVLWDGLSVAMTNGFGDATFRLGNANETVGSITGYEKSTIDTNGYDLTFTSSFGSFGSFATWRGKTMGGGNIILDSPGGGWTLSGLGMLSGVNLRLRNGTLNFSSDGYSDHLSDNLVISVESGGRYSGTFSSRETIKNLTGDAGSIDLSSGTSLTLLDGAGGFGGKLSGGGSFRKNGSGLYTLSGDSGVNWSGETVMGGGTLAFGQTSNLGSTTAGKLNFSGGTLSYTGTGVANLGARLQNFGRTIIVTPGNQYLFDVANAGAEVINDFTMANPTTGTAGLVKTGAGTLTLGGKSTYGGETVIENGAVRLQGTNNGGTNATGDVLPNNHIVRFQSGAGQLVLGNADETIGNVLGNNSDSNIVLNGYVLTLTGASGGFAGGISGGGGSTLVIQGGGTFTMTGASPDFGGTVRVDSGSLVVNGDLGDGSVQVVGGELGGSGSLGSIVLDIGTIAPGNSIGTFHATSLLWNPNGQLAMEIGGLMEQFADLIELEDAFNFASSGTYLVNFFDAGNLRTNVTYDLVRYRQGASNRGDYAVNLQAVPDGNTIRTLEGAFNFEDRDGYTYMTYTASVFQPVPVSPIWLSLPTGVLFMALSGMRRKRRG
ncbi:MAG: autotransporter-associated beta strand repeat-containing protein, partial [Fibrella sp.]|nr:autotransporter-associated beta strand repeat-containing protein [Armatimonadota bacterium]